MANNTNTKRGPGRPPRSKNKPKNSSQSSAKSQQQAVTPEQIRQERIARMQAEYDRDRRNVDVIWSITLFALGLFLFFTVVMDTTGSFGMKVHDICLGLFGFMAMVLPFMVILFAILLFARKLQHIGGRTIAFSILIFINMCILNSYRFIDETNLVFNLPTIAQYYVNGVNGDDGGVFGMVFGSILVKFFGKPGLLIIASATLLISIFLVANSPISRFFNNMVNKMEKRRIMREMEEAEMAKVQMAVAKTATPGADPRTGIAPGRVTDESDYTIVEPQQGKSLWKSILNGIAKNDEPDEIPPVKASNQPARADQGRAVIVDRAPASAPKAPEISSPEQVSKGGMDLDNLPEQKDNSVMELVNRDTLFGRLTRKLTGKQTDEMKYDDDDDADYGYPGRRVTKKEEPAASTSGLRPADQAEPPKRQYQNRSYGLGDPDDVGHSGSYGLMGTRKQSTGTGLEDVSSAAGNAAGAGIASRRAMRQTDTVKEETPKVTKKSSASDNAGTLAAKPAKPAPETPEDKAEMDKDDAALAESFNAQADDVSYELPPVSLLKKPTGPRQMMSDYQLEQKADLLEKTLNDFGVDAKVLTVTQGASVTRYEVQPATGVKVSSITRLQDDIALNLRAKTIRIEAPIPGKAAVGIEVENDKPSPVLIRELIESDEFMEAKSRLSFVVGKDISGNNIIANLKDMPHLLIAGATGSGKSVCINTIITSFLYKAKPSELKLIMIDPKVVELANYNGIPHMLTPVVTDARKASRALAIAVEEMDKRYELFAKEGVKDLESYNELMIANHERQNCKPQVVIIIDELADLMMAAPSEVENSICRLAQKARAAGMHLIVATQRPSVDVVTGLIKANIPSRIAFSVASQFDSRTILDMAGAEKLLGKGDMLFSPVGSNKPYRVQGPYISDSETEKVIKFVKKEGGGPVYDEELKSAIDNADKKSSSEPQDELTDDAIAFILKSKQASVSMLQRRFRIGYNRAARIIDEIEEKGIIGPSDGSRPRQVLVTEDEYYNGGSNAAGADEQYEVDPQRMAEIESAVTGKPHMNLVANQPKSEPEPVTEQVSEERVNSAVDYFNSLPESVRRQILDADHHYDD
ncbi:MAG: DNA translocase FtsK 4TM domain-containing protein [Mogibacterium sp.]|nr:DNA translocase FtsK 4TM domain-containing protein [Mogibacterium sp.]